MKRFDTSVYWITDLPRVAVDAWLVAAEAAARAGMTTLQLRAKTASAESQVHFLRSVLPALRALGVTVLVNDRVDVALESGADGVHLGQSDGDVSDARRRLGEDAVLGLSVTAIDEAHRVPLDIVDYVGVGPIFSTASKADATAPLGVDGLRAIRRVCPLPLVAIGGIDPVNAAGVLEAGADGLSAVAAFLPDPSVCSRAFHDAVEAHRRRTQPRALTIAGSDSGGGAGIQADLKTFEALDVYGMSALTAVTAQDTVGVAAVLALSPSLVRAQIERVLGDLGADAVKIGMLANAEIVTTVADVLEKQARTDVVLDPVLVAKSGDALLEHRAVEALRRRLLPHAALVTPNLPEAEALLGRTIDSRAAMERAAADLAALGPSVLLKGGHLVGAEAPDFYYSKAGERRWLEAPRIRTRNSHGTGCTLSAAVAAYRAWGNTWEASVALAKTYLAGALRSAAHRRRGHGTGPVDHRWGRPLTGTPLESKR